MLINKIIDLIRPQEPKFEKQVPQLQPPLIGPKNINVTIYKNYLTINKYSRPGIKRDLNKIKGIEIHWVGNPNTSAKLNRDFFESRKGGKLSYGSSHYIIDLNGDVYQIIPDDEIAYSSGTSAGYKSGIVGKFGNPPYKTTLSIECTHINWAGEMTKETYNALVKLCVILCNKYALTARDLVRHYDISGKECPRWFVTNPSAWDKFRDEVDALLT